MTTNASKNKYEKKANVINRTTSETLRLGEVLSQATSSPIAIQTLPQSRKKIIQNSSSSFQITGVSMTRIDLGDDSADDLDESHTDDISRVTDNETPSFSEDSRDIDDHPMHEPVVAPSTSLLATLEAPKAETKPKPPDEDTGARFKVVKIPSKIPFSRGRWTCFDYLDNNEQNLNFIQANVKFLEKPSQAHLSKVVAGTIRGLQAPQIEANFITRQEMIVDEKQKPATQSSIAQKNDIISDIKDALTATPASNSGSTPNNNNIDRKIEEALDAVKTHLMVAVHKEVDFLKTRVSTLEGRVNELEIENSILRVNYLLFKS